MDFNDFLEFEQDDNLLKLNSQRNKRTIPENSIEARRSLFDNWVVQGSFHQGDIRFGINSGKQCVANCLSALAHSKFKDLNDWNQIYLDNVLIDGNKIYSRIHGDNIHLLVSDLPDMIDMSGMLLKISRKESITAVVDTSGTIDFSEFGNSLPLDQALQESLIDYDACFICAYDTTFLALKHNQDLLLFDSHARNKLGLKDSDGKSLLLKLSNLDHLYQYCCNMMAGASQNQWFEVTGVSICIFGQEPKIKTNDELSGNHKPLITSEFRLSEILETVNKDEIPKSQENITQISNISPEILQLNICSNDIENVNEVHINEVINDDESDIEILSTAECFYDFIPLNTLLKRKLCKFVNIPSKKISKQNSTNFYNIGQPTACKTITGDGNCLFRAISYSLSNRQEYFGDIRRAIVDHLLRNAEVFKSFLQPRFKTVEEHIQTLRMEENNVWGTELEIVACADLLKTDIYTFFNGTWIKYSSSQINSNNCVNDQAIYLQHNGDINHYEVVTAVKQKTISPNGLQSRQEHEYDISRKSEVSTKKMKIDENQMNDSLNNTESKVLKNEKERIRYMTDDKFRARKIDTSKRKYQENEGIRSKKICSGIKKYEENETYRENLIQAGIQKYEEDEDYRNILIQAGIEKYKEDNEYREKLKQASIHKYKANEKHKEHVKQESIHKYKTDEKHKEHVIQESIHKYKTDEKHKKESKTDENKKKHKYKTDEKHKEHVKQESIHKYKTDEKHKEHVKQESIHKYKTDEKHKEHVKQESIHKYKTDEKHKEHVKQESIHKYKTDEKHKEHVKQASIHKYANDDAHRIKIKQQTSVRRENLQVENKQINEVIRKFKVEVNKGPECVCACCLRLFFEKQVQICKKENYDNSIFDLVTTDKYQHKCTDDCKTNCAFEGTCRTSLWICYTCHRKMLKGKIPADSFSNSLLLEDVPVELKQLNSIEQQLIAQNIPFMKIMALPKGGQKGVHGPVVCVPSDLKKVTSILPRSEDESLLLKVKLKRKLSYKGYDKYQFVRPNHLEQALLYLKDQNIWYKDVAINKEWLNPIPELNDDQVVDDESESDDTELVRENIKEEEKIKTTSSTTGNEREIESEPASYIDDRLRGVQLDTCLQPADIGQEALDLCFDQVFNIAPAENNSPLSVLQESGIEAKTFPVHFPTGKNTFDEIRDEKLTIGRPPSTKTFISEPSKPDKDTKKDEKVAKEILSGLWKVIKEHENENLDVSEIFNKSGLTQESFEKEVSAQEAVFRVTGLRLRECSRKVEFIPVGENPCRMSIPLKDLEKQQSYKSSNRKRSNNDSEDENDDENKIWMNNIVDRYKGRPHIAMFIKMCLASFGSEYSVLLESQLPQKINEETTFKLDGNLGHIRKRTRTSPAVIKYPRFSQETSPEKYFQSILQLFLPYRHDEQLKPPLFNTYENFFTCGRVKFTGDNTLTSVKEVVIKNMADFVKTGQELEDAENQLHETDPKEDAWCELCPESELNRRECIDEGKVTSVIEEDLSEATIPDLNNAKSSSSVGTNLLSVSLTKNEIIPRLRSLNVKQRRILYKVRDWCIQKANGKIPKPLHVFITGGAGTGKSHLIKCIQYEATRVLAQTSDNPDDLTLPPVRTKRVDKLYVNDPSNPSNHLWNDLFEIAELDEIMRQREDSLFAELLNRLRVKQKNENLTSFDMETLIRCLGDGHDEALHIYSTNAEVDTFNKEMILKLCSEPKLIEAEDYEKNKTSGKLTLKKVHCTKSDVCLPISILLAEGARVMLIKNEDTSDGLVNGVMGTVISIKDYSVNSLPSAIFVFFDNERVGKNAKLQKIICGKRCVGLKPSSEDIPLSTCVRKQFPLKLAWACTIHKVQGLTVEECVVDLNKCFTYGQAYVALSRVTSKSGLHIKSIETEKLDKKIFCDPDIVKGVAEMTRFLPEVEDEREEQKDIVQIMYHNIQGLQAHAEDLKQNPDFIDVDFICLTETWANQEFACFEMIGYDGFHLPRSQAFENDNSYYSSLKEMQHGGVCVFYKHSSETELCNLASNLECIIFKIKTENILVATIYRTQKYNVGKFLENLETLICKMQELSEKIVIIGDFNQDILKGFYTVLNFMQSKGFNQLVNSPTTEGGTLIDHVYVRGCPDISVAIMPTYYSYHEALRIVLKS
ncbi:unnamed protein product [Mytilus edulis]|uniref:OTU domain-containing protein n=1 Tax=Mytilus edulis TaxID=6550 RepID=A0A8S3PRK8_MYTED|nr:unnamed protein product [Mytilus edulis]